MKYPLSHGLEYLVDIPELAFGRRMAWLTRIIQRFGQIFTDLAAKVSADADLLHLSCEGVEGTVTLAAMAQQQAEQPGMAEEEIEFFSRLLHGFTQSTPSHR